MSESDEWTPPTPASPPTDIGVRWTITDPWYETTTLASHGQSGVCTQVTPNPADPKFDSLTIRFNDGDTGDFKRYELRRE